jgi:hypothetical protein
MKQAREWGGGGEASKQLTRGSVEQHSAHRARDAKLLVSLSNIAAGEREDLVQLELHFLVAYHIRIAQLGR